MAKDKVNKVTEQKKWDHCRNCFWFQGVKPGPDCPFLHPGLCFGGGAPRAELHPVATNMAGKVPCYVALWPIVDGDQLGCPDLKVRLPERATCRERRISECRKGRR